MIMAQDSLCNLILSFHSRSVWLEVTEYNSTPKKSEAKHTNTTMVSFPTGSETSNTEFSNPIPTNEAKDNRIGPNNFITAVLADDP